VTRRIGTDAVANEACELLCEAFWTYAGSLVLTYGAWDGVVVTGALARVLQAHLAAPRMQAVFAGTGKYARLLAAVPRTYMAVEHGELFGAAEALLRQP
jgi:glucokinase